MYYQKIALVVSLCALASAVSGATHRWANEFREAIHHTFSSDTTIDVDDINGTIEIIGDNGATMRVEGEKIIRAEDQTEMDRAKREVTLDINEKDKVAQLYVNGPFRHNDRSDDHGFHDHADRHYEVTYNLTVHVPHSTEIRLRTVNGGIRAEQTNGKFDVHNVNGTVTMNSIAGAGSARTVNGELVLAFASAPTGPSEFQTVNGRIEATFPPNLSANVRVKTLNGGAFTDFDATSLAAEPLTTDRRNGRTAFRTQNAKHLKIGNGGPELNFQTVNGSISIRKGTAK